MSAFRLYDYRIFCVDCAAVCDVRGVSESDAEREARARGWFVSPQANSAVSCPLCLDRTRKAKATHPPATRSQP